MPANSPRVVHAERQRDEPVVVVPGVGVADGELPAPVQGATEVLLQTRNKK